MYRGLFTDKIDKLKLHGGTIKYFNIFVNRIRKMMCFRLCKEIEKDVFRLVMELRIFSSSHARDKTKTSFPILPLVGKAWLSFSRRIVILVEWIQSISSGITSNTLFSNCIQLPCCRKVSDALQSCTVVVIPVILVDGTQNA